MPEPHPSEKQHLGRRQNAALHCRLAKAQPTYRKQVTHIVKYRKQCQHVREETKRVYSIPNAKDYLKLAHIEEKSHRDPKTSFVWRGSSIPGPSFKTHASLHETSICLHE